MNNEKKWTEGDVRAEIDRLSAGVEPLVRQLGEVAREIRAVGRPLGIDGTGVLTNLFVEHVVHRHAECVSEILAKSPTEREAIFKRGFKLDEESRVRRLARAFAEAGEAKYAEGLNAYAESFVEPEEEEDEEEEEEEKESVPQFTGGFKMALPSPDPWSVVFGNKALPVGEWVTVSPCLAKDVREGDIIQYDPKSLRPDSRVRRVVRNGSNVAMITDSGGPMYLHGDALFVIPDGAILRRLVPDTSTLGLVGSTPDGAVLMARVLRDGKLPEGDARELLRQWALSACVSVEHLALLSRLWLGIGRPSVAEDFDRRAAKLKEYPDGGCEHIVGGHCGLESCR